MHAPTCPRRSSAADVRHRSEHWAGICDFASCQRAAPPPSRWRRGALCAVVAACIARPWRLDNAPAHGVVPRPGSEGSGSVADPPSRHNHREWSAWSAPAGRHAGLDHGSCHRWAQLHRWGEQSMSSRHGTWLQCACSITEASESADSSRLRLRSLSIAGLTSCGWTLHVRFCCSLPMIRPVTCMPRNSASYSNKHGAG